MSVARAPKKNQDVKAFVDGLNFVSPLNPRDAFYGGVPMPRNCWWKERRSSMWTLQVCIRILIKTECILWDILR